MAARLAIGTNARERLRRLAVVFAVELRMKIVVELYMRVMSAPQFNREFGGGSPTRINQNFSRLADKGWLKLIHREGPGGDRRGGIELFYRATELPFMDAESWALLPYSVRVTSSWNMFTQIAPRLRGDLEVSSKDARTVCEPLRGARGCTSPFVPQWRGFDPGGCLSDRVPIPWHLAAPSGG